MTDKLNVVLLKKQREESLQRKQINFRYMMGIAEIFSPFLIQSIPAALTIVSIGNLFPTLLHIPIWLAWVLAGLVGIGLELLGIVSVDVYFEAKSYNQKYKEDKEKAPEGAALLVMIVYAVTALLTVVFLKMFSALAIWSLIPLTLMSILIVSSVTMKKRLDDLLLQKDNNVNVVNNNVIDILQNEIEMLTQRLNVNNNEIKMLTTELQKNDNEISLLKKQLHKDRNEITVLTPDNNVKLSKEQKMKMLIEYLIENYNGLPTDEIVNTEIANALPIDNVTVGRYIKELKSKNKLNGHVDSALLRAI